MELSTFAALTADKQFETLATMDLATVNQLRMAAEQAADAARFVARDSATVGRMTLIITRAAGESMRRFAPARPAKRFTGCVAKENGRWVAA